MDGKIIFEIGLPTLYNNHDIEKALIENQSEFDSYFLRLIDNGDSRQEITDNCLRIGNITNHGNIYMAELLFGYGSYSGCSDMNSEDDYDTTVEFKIVDNTMIFDISLPPAWKPL